MGPPLGIDPITHCITSRCSITDLHLVPMNPMSCYDRSYHEWPLYHRATSRSMSCYDWSHHEWPLYHKTTSRSMSCYDRSYHEWPLYHKTTSCSYELLWPLISRVTTLPQSYISFHELLWLITSQVTTLPQNYISFHELLWPLISRVTTLPQNYISLLWVAMTAHITSDHSTTELHPAAWLPLPLSATYSYEVVPLWATYSYEVVVLEPDDVADDDRVPAFGHQLAVAQHLRLAVVDQPIAPVALLAQETSYNKHTPVIHTIVIGQKHTYLQQELAKNMHIFSKNWPKTCISSARIGQKHAYLQQELAKNMHIFSKNWPKTHISSAKINIWQ